TSEGSPGLWPHIVERHDRLSAKPDRAANLLALHAINWLNGANARYVTEYLPQVRLRYPDRDHRLSVDMAGFPVPEREMGAERHRQAEHGTVQLQGSSFAIIAGDNCLRE